MSGNGCSGVDSGQAREADEAWMHLARLRDKVAGYAAVKGFVVSDIFLPSMPETSMRSPGGSALIDLLKALDSDEAGQEVSRSEADDFARFAHVPFLVVTLLHEETGVRVALLGAAYCEN